MANFFLLPYLAVLCAASLPAPPPRTAIVRAGRSGATSVPRPPARGPLRSESTPNSLWPAPVSLVRAGNDSWAKLGDNVAAVGADCVYTQHGPGPLLACQRACESAGAQGCNVINYDAAIDDCVFRRCDDPAHPALTPADGYAVYALSRPALASYGLSPASFSFVVAGASSRTLTAALARYVNWTFAFGPGAAGAPADVAALRVNVLAAGDELEFGADESYELVVAPRNNSAPSTLTAPTVWGALRGLETFAQLVSFDLGARTYSVQSATVADAPRFPFRGVLLDTSRHFLSLSALKEVVEAMSWAKLNVLSLHLSDDQSWPLVVASAPLLALRSAFSNYSHVYTPAMIADLVDFAKLRGVRVLPELDSPSHFGSLFAAYPQYAAQAVDANNNSYLCMVDPSRDEVYAFLAGIWSDAAAMFPDLTFRVGGDELQGCWADSPAVLAWMKKEGLPNIDAAYYYYVRKLVGIMRGLSPPRNTIAWLDVAGFWTNQSWAHDYSDVVLDVWTGCLQRQLAARRRRLHRSRRQGGRVGAVLHHAAKRRPRHPALYVAADVQHGFSQLHRKYFCRNSARARRRARRVGRRRPNRQRRRHGVNHAVHSRRGRGLVEPAGGDVWRHARRGQAARPALPPGAARPRLPPRLRFWDGVSDGVRGAAIRLRERGGRGRREKRKEGENV